MSDMENIQTNDTNGAEKNNEALQKAMAENGMYERDSLGRMVLCAANAYEKKFFINPAFNAMPESVKQELQIISVLFTEEAGGIFMIVFEEDGSVSMATECAEEDILYDEISAGLLVGEIRKHRQELFEQVELFYRVFILKESIDLDE